MATIQEEENLIDYSPKSPTKGGLKTMPFIIVNETLEKVASYGLQPNMVIYLMKGYNLEAVTATSILNIWSALSHGLALLGAFVSDSFFGRFRVVAIGSISSLFGMTILWLTTMIPPLRPLPCDQFEINECNKPTPAQFFVLLFSFGIIAVGAGFVRPCSIAFGADQLDNKENPKNKRIMESYFNWYYATIGMSTLVATTLIVYIQDAFGWQIGFGIPAILMLFSVSAFLLGSPLYIKVNASESLFTGFFQVLVAAVRKRNINLHSANCGNYYHHSPDSEIQALTNSFRHTGQQGGLSPVLRMGIGLVLSSAALAISAITEAIRRHIAIDQKDIYPQDGPNIASVDMSAMWFVPQYVLLGLADAFNAIGLVEFLYSELPKSMSSFVVAIFTLGMAVSGFFGSLIVNVLDSVTSYGGEISWLSSNINKGHLDYYYWLLAFFNILNFLYFLLICQYNRPQGPS
ncbi:protein NRT1/ PTR FAMILY 1.2-like isoform X2 [Nicotiana sylvestris]|uniref:Protein NRT1/ PTR FAMILY 1.2-like isoform X2 n=1 Tax=Nicotiana sylvestris TaxID=4096 RepID=A0A1U7X8J1_NICSY|nr:PREDICTED: protein NRT1/ PTR FAMILY 1.2-like isoform X2 [Nicotiana sylvestris]